MTNGQSQLTVIAPTVTGTGAITTPSISLAGYQVAPITRRARISSRAQRWTLSASSNKPTRKIP